MNGYQVTQYRKTHLGMKIEVERDDIFGATDKSRAWKWRVHGAQFTFGHAGTAEDAAATAEAVAARLCNLPVVAERKEAEA